MTRFGSLTSAFVITPSYLSFLFLGREDAPIPIERKAPIPRSTLPGHSSVSVWSYFCVGTLPMIKDLRISIPQDPHPHGA